jgi:hypothetical protein
MKVMVTYWARTRRRLFGCCPEDDSGQDDDFCFAPNWSLRVLARAHSKKEAGNGDVGHYGGGRVTEGIGGKACGLEQVSQQLACDGFLAFGCWVCVVIGTKEGTKEGTQGRSHVCAFREVKGVVLDIVLERCSQTACGRAHSACDHWRATTPG